MVLFTYYSKAVYDRQRICMLRTKDNNTFFFQSELKMYYRRKTDPFSFFF